MSQSVQDVYTIQTHPYRQEESLLEQRLQAIEKRLRLSGPDKEFDSPEMHTATSPTIQENHESRRSPGMKGPLDQDDGVDGMGAVALKDGADEEEYFGTVQFITANCFMGPCLTI